MDTLLIAVDTALRTLYAQPHAAQTWPASQLDAASTQRSAALMRVNHTGEICAQALYTAQAFATKNKALRAHFIKAGADEANHLAWTQQRVRALGGRTSVLNPLWYAGAFGIGLLAGALGDGISLGFVQETERQVGAHLQGHLEALPENDQTSRAIVAKMRQDELRHADDAHAAGAVELPRPVKALMRAAAKVMTTTVERGF